MENEGEVERGRKGERVDGVGGGGKRWCKKGGKSEDVVEGCCEGERVSNGGEGRERKVAASVRGSTLMKMCCIVVACEPQKV